LLDCEFFQAFYRRVTNKDFDYTGCTVLAEADGEFTTKQGDKDHGPKRVVYQKSIDCYTKDQNSENGLDVEVYTDKVEIILWRRAEWVFKLTFNKKGEELERVDENDAFPDITPKTFLRPAQLK
jgi:hypothetical protein